MLYRNKKPPGISAGIQLCLAFALAFLAFPALAFTTYLNDFNANYGTLGTRLDTCGLCHVDFNGAGTRTSYGEDYRNNNFSAANIGILDSDGDGFSNDQEAAASTLTHPGYSCAEQFTVINAPANVADYLDPANPGCIGPGQVPIANANGPYSGVTGELISFSSAGSTDPDGTIVSYLWDFGGYGTSTDANPQMAFTSNFSINLSFTLTVIDNDGNQTTTTSSVIILMSPNSPPVANAGPAVSGTVNVPVSFNGGGSTDPEGARLRYAWDFGDQTSGVGGAISHAYTSCGLYTVTLTVSDDVNLKDTATTTASIAGDGITPPVANAGGGATNTYNGTVGSNVQFDGSGSVDPDCDIASYNWDFGDGSTGIGITPVHSYALAGGYVVTLTVTDSDGLMTSAFADVTIVDAGPLDGQALYDTNCGGCHGMGTGSTKAGATVARIDAGIATVPSMASLSTLSAAEIQAIADFLGTINQPPGPIDGAASYDANCGSCHGMGTSSTKAGATVARIDAGINTVPSMATLSNLSAEEIQAIADFLGTINQPPGPIDGAASYDANCGSCHGMGTSSTKAGATVARIEAGINTVPSMATLSILSAEEIQAIADFLGTINQPPGPVGGEAAYDANCGSCHGLGTSSTKAGATVARIEAGIAAVPSMGSLSSLSAEQIQSISDFLMTIAPPSTPEGLYAAHCASCHGADGSGGITGVNVIGDSASKISSAITSEADMQSLSFLSSNEIQLISDFLNGVTTPPPGTLDGQALYDVNCAGCHGLSSNSAKAGADATRINNGIANEPSMAFFSTSLTSAEIQAIGDFLVSLAPPTGGDGSSLYTINCAACHGPGDNSSKAGATVARINNGISAVSSMNFLSSVLSTADIQAIADFLASSPAPSTPQEKYVAYCASCHGVDGRGGSSGEKVTGDSAGDIKDAIREESEMQSLSFLTDDDIRDIASHLDVLKEQ